MFTFFFFLYLFVTDPVLSEYSSSDEEKEAELRKEKILKKFTLPAVMKEASGPRKQDFLLEVYYEYKKKKMALAF